MLIEILILIGFAIGVAFLISSFVWWTDLRATNSKPNPQGKVKFEALKPLIDYAIENDDLKGKHYAERYPKSLFGSYPIDEDAEITFDLREILIELNSKYYKMTFIEYIRYRIYFEDKIKQLERRERKKLDDTIINRVEDLIK